MERIERRHVPVGLGLSVLLCNTEKEARMPEFSQARINITWNACSLAMHVILKKSERMRHDMIYLDNQSIFFDLQILLSPFEP